MANFNRVIIAGNLTRDPELKYLANGTAIASFGVAINRTWKDANGEARQETTFVDVSAFSKQAETIGQYFKKGKPILVEGRLKLDQWEDKTTHQKQSKLKVVLESFSFLDSKPEGGTTAPVPTAPPPTAPSPQPAENNKPPSDPNDDWSDVPF